MFKKLKKYNLYLILILVLGAVLRFINISKSAIWHDEGFTIDLISKPWGQIMALTAKDVHPPLYYYVLKFWTLIFGTSEIGLRSLSVIFGLGIIIFAFLTVKKLFNEKTALLASLFLAFGPFLIRYSQETRMWMMVAFITTLATYFLLKALESNKKSFWIFYGLTLTAGVYTQYFAALIIPVHWLFIISKSIQNKNLKPLFTVNWWLSNITWFALFSPWVRVVLAQTSRVSASYWIQRAWFNFRTVPDTIYEFLTYRHFDPWPSFIHEGILIILVIGGVILIFRQYKNQWPGLVLILALVLVPLYLIYFYTILRTPIYQDRYFPFAAVGFYIFMALLVFSVRHSVLRKTFIGLTLAAFLFGIYSLWISEPHLMNKIADVVNTQYKPGDIIISGELYTYFDYSYYNKTGYEPLLFAGNLDGFGETSLLVDRADRILIPDLSKARPESGFVWFIGKPGKDYYKNAPQNWKIIESFEASDGSVVKYQLSRSL